MFGSSLVYTALLSQGTLGFANAIFGVTLIVGTSMIGVGSIEDDAFGFLLPDGFAPSTAPAV